MSVFQMSDLRHWKYKKLAQSHTYGKTEIKTQIIYLQNLYYSPVNFTTTRKYESLSPSRHGCFQGATLRAEEGRKVTVHGPWSPNVGGFPVVPWQRICLPTQETWEMRVQSLAGEDALEEDMATHSTVLAWRVP